MFAICCVWLFHSDKCNSKNKLSLQPQLFRMYGAPPCGERKQMENSRKSKTDPSLGKKSEYSKLLKIPNIEAGSQNEKIHGQEIKSIYFNQTV